MHANLKEGGFYTHYFIVQQLTFFVTLLCVAFLWLNWVLWLRRCDKAPSLTYHEEYEEKEGGEEEVEAKSLPQEEEKHP